MYGRISMLHLWYKVLISLMSVWIRDLSWHSYSTILIQLVHFVRSYASFIALNTVTTQHWNRAKRNTYRRLKERDTEFWSAWQHSHQQVSAYLTRLWVISRGIVSQLVTWILRPLACSLYYEGNNKTFWWVVTPLLTYTMPE